MDDVILESGQIWSKGNPGHDVFISMDDNGSIDLRAIFDDGSVLEADSGDLLAELIYCGYSFAGYCNGFKVWPKE